MNELIITFSFISFLLAPLWLICGVIATKNTMKQLKDNDQQPWLNMAALIGGPVTLGSFYVLNKLAEARKRKKEEEWKKIDTTVTLLHQDGTPIDPAPAKRSEIDSRKLFFQIVEDAFKSGATRIYITPDEEGEYSIDYRIAGKLEHKRDMDCLSGGGLCNVFKRLSGMSVDERRYNQNGTILARQFGQDNVCRVSSGRSFGGEKITVRMRDELLLPDITALGLNQEQLDLLAKRLNCIGVIVFCGPAGCGKSTTMRSVLSSSLMDGISRIFVENPIGMTLENVTMVEENPIEGPERRRLSVAEIAESDYQVMAIEPVSDAESAAAAFKAAADGKLVLIGIDGSTLEDILIKLEGWGISLNKIAESLSLVVNQRLAFRADGQGRIAFFDLIDSQVLYDYMSDGRATMQSVREKAGDLFTDSGLRASAQDMVDSGWITPLEAARAMGDDVTELEAAEKAAAEAAAVKQLEQAENAAKSKKKRKGKK